MLKTLRTNTKSIMIIVSVCFVAMMVFAWGMDITGRRSRMQTGVVGVINGQKISTDTYGTIIQNRRQSLGEQQRSDYVTERRLHSEVWEEIVNQTIIAQEIKKRKISFTDRELLSFILSNPPQVVYQVPLFQENGTFSITKYQSFVSNPDNYKNPQTASLMQYLETQAKSTLPFLKFQEMVTGGILIPDVMVRDRWLQENEKRTIDWVFITPARFNNAVLTPSQQELEAYYNEHKKDYEHQELRAVDAVLFELVTSEQDSADVLERIRMLAQRAKSGENFADLANGYSEDPGNRGAQNTSQGGDLGWFGRGMMVKTFEDVAFGLKPGEVSDPLLTQFGYHIVKVDSVQYKVDAKGKPTNEIEKIKAAHILLKIEPSARSREKMENGVKAFYDAVTTGKKDFTQLAQETGLTVNRSQPFNRDATYISNVGPFAELLAKRVFNSKKGEILPIYYTDQGAYVVQVAEIVPAGIPSFQDVMSRVTQDVQRKKRMELAEEAINGMYQRVKSGMSIEEAAMASSDSTLKFTARTSTLTRVENVPGLGSMSPLTAAAFNLKTVGECTEPVKTDLGVGIAVLKEKQPVDEAQYQSEKEELRERMKRDSQEKVLTRIVEELRKKAKIVDDRYMYYNL
ncbi:peptidylprolyl isomerase [bacterium]|nr:peptidylprolyl isomerase [bacterium]